MKFFIIHGSYGKPNENWNMWLKEKLEEKGNIVFVPEFPAPPKQSLKNWYEEFNDFYLSKVDSDSLLIGHSLGPAFILRLLERINLPKPLKACFFISGFLGNLGMNNLIRLIRHLQKRILIGQKLKITAKGLYYFMEIMTLTYH